MEIIPGLPLPLTLALLALLDGLSVGTLLIPIFFLVVPGRVRGGRMLLYLGTIAAFYLVVGVLFLLGLINVVDFAREFLSSPAGTVVRLAAGALLMAFGLLLATVDSARKRAAKAAAARVAAGGAGGGGPAGGSPVPAPSGRMVRWREKLLSAQTPPTAIMGVAVAAGLVEIATMLPYIMGMTMLADSAVPFPLQVGALAGYCALMIVPAIVLLVLRVAAARLIDRPLQKLAAWLQRTAAENTVTILVIIGFLIVRPAATELGIFDWLGSLRD